MDKEIIKSYENEELKNTLTRMNKRANDARKCPHKDGSTLIVSKSILNDEKRFIKKKNNKNTFYESVDAPGVTLVCVREDKNKDNNFEYVFIIDSTINGVEVADFFSYKLIRREGSNLLNIHADIITEKKGKETRDANYILVIDKCIKSNARVEDIETDIRDIEGHHILVKWDYRIKSIAALSKEEHKNEMKGSHKLIMDVNDEVSYRLLVDYLKTTA